jgi:spermidine synthase
LAKEYFAKENYDVLKDPRVEVVYDDARHYLLTTPEKFDVITSDPIHPWVKGSASLYSREYFDLCMRHLNPGGVVTQWVPLYESDLDVVRCELKTFFEVFPAGIVWGNLNNRSGYDVVLFGRDSPAPIDVDAVQKRLDGNSLVARSLREVGFRSAVDLLATYSGQAADMQDWLADAQINRDLNLRLQYLAGMGVNNDRAGAIFNAILERCGASDWPFQGSEQSLAALNAAIEERNYEAQSPGTNAAAGAAP